MLYLQNNTEQQGLFVPHAFDPTGNLKFTAKSTTNPSAPEIDITITDYATRRFYVFFYLNLPSGMTTGEYEFKLEDDERTLDTGVLVIGEYSKPQEYNGQIQYGA